MRSSTRAERLTLTLWAILAVIVWNGVYDVLVTRGVKEYLLQRAMHEAGHGPAVQLAAMMDLTVQYAARIATLWASIILLAGLVTIRTLAGGRKLHGDGPHAS